MGMTGGRGSEQGTEFLHADFPTLLLKDDDDPANAALLHDYLDWQAPWLLLLDTLSESQRQALEAHARSRAQEMVKQHHLYPALVDPAQIKAAQVELVLREKQAQHERQAEARPDTSPFYMEISPAGGEYT